MFAPKIHYIHSKSEVITLAKTSVLQENLITMNLHLGELGRNFKDQSANDQEVIEHNHCGFGLDDTQKLLGYF